MNETKQHAFLDSNVLLQYVSGKSELRKLFAPETVRRITYSVNPVVLQELLLALETVEGEVDVDSLGEHFSVIASNSIFDPEVLAPLRELGADALHTNDLLILGDAQKCDVLLTYDDELLALRDKSKVPITTPEEFLASLAVDR